MAKHTSKRVISLIIFFLFTQSCQKQPNNIDVSSGYESIVTQLEDAIWYEIDSKNLNAISIILVDDQKIIWAKGFGYEDPQKLISADAYTVYRVGSVSKLFTDMAIMQRVEKGEINLDEPIQTYLPDFKPNPAASTAIILTFLSFKKG